MADHEGALFTTMGGVKIHATAIVSSGAQIGERVCVGPYAIVEDKTEIGDDCVISACAQILAGTRIGDQTRVGQGAVLGGRPQSVSFDARTPSFVAIGRGNRIGEFVTIHRATKEGGTTWVGDDNEFRVGSHVGHDTEIRHGNMIGSAVLLAGHVRMGSHVDLGSRAVFHQFIRIGDYSRAQQGSGSSKDIPPFSRVAHINRLMGMNAVGLRRAGFAREEQREIREVFRMVLGDGQDLSRGIALAERRSWGEGARRFLEFVREPTSRGLCARRT